MVPNSGSTRRQGQEAQRTFLVGVLAVASAARASTAECMGHIGHRRHLTRRLCGSEGPRGPSVCSLGVLLDAHKNVATRCRLVQARRGPLEHSPHHVSKENRFPRGLGYETRRCRLRLEDAGLRRGHPTSTFSVPLRRSVRRGKMDLAIINLNFF